MTILNTSNFGVVSVCLAFMVFALPVSADYSSNTLFFPEVTYFDNFDRPSVTNIKDSTTHPAITVLHAGSLKPIKTLLEFSANRHHQKIKRLQLSMNINDDHHIRLGRAHTPLGYWNTEYHHGTYLYTSLSRPGPTMTFWPRHITGIALDGDLNEHISYDFLIGLGPKIKHGSISDFDIIDPEDDHELSFSAKLSYKPNATDDTEFGLSFAYFDHTFEGSSHEDFKQYLINAYVNWVSGKNRIISEVYYSHSNIPEHDISGDDDFITGYIQYERIIIPDLSIYGRLEDSIDEENARLIKTLSSYTTEAAIIGIRFDFFDNHALAIEAASKDRLNDQFNSIGIKWSAVFSW